MRVELRRDLNTVAARLAAPTVERLARDVADAARERAPAAKVWISRDDERVRPAHVAAHGQTIPANLRFKLPRQAYIHGGGRGSNISGHTVIVPGYDLARRPRDKNLPPDQRANCRCLDATLPKLIARRIHVSPVVVTGSQARAQVSVRFLRIVETEFGTGEDRAARFLGGAVDVVAARLRARARRT